MFRVLRKNKLNELIDALQKKSEMNEEKLKYHKSVLPKIYFLPKPHKSVTT